MGIEKESSHIIQPPEQERVRIYESPEFKKYQELQQIAANTMESLKGFIRQGITEKEIRDEAERLLKEQGVNKFWYPTLIYAGQERTLVSVSSKDYQATDTEVPEIGIVTADISPEQNGIRADYADTLAIQNGRIVEPEELTIPEIAEGIAFEKELHQIFQREIRGDMTFDEAYHFINSIVTKRGFKNLDLHGNLGHIIKKPGDPRRISMEAGEMTRLDQVDLFTFEPHTGKAEPVSLARKKALVRALGQGRGGNYGFKRERIYYADKDGNIQPLLPKKSYRQP